uniref:Uncharacterized protein n=1 Tax=Rhizophora mucronata TaxID=61149 RepID=A0A2P2PXB1_RHIMU
MGWIFSMQTKIFEVKETLKNTNGILIK